MQATGKGRRRLQIAIAGGIASIALAASGAVDLVAEADTVPVATHLHTEPNVAEVQSDDWPHATYWFPGLTAVLTRTDTGGPVAGRTVHFVASGAVVCTAVTDPLGQARCSGTIEQELGVVADLGYEAYFLGDDEFGASESHSGLATFDDTDLF